MSSQNVRHVATFLSIFATKMPSLHHHNDLHAVQRCFPVLHQETKNDPFSFSQTPSRFGTQDLSPGSQITQRSGQRRDKRNIGGDKYVWVCQTPCSYTVLLFKQSPSKLVVRLANWCWAHMQLKRLWEEKERILLLSILFKSKHLHSDTSYASIHTIQLGEPSNTSCLIRISYCLGTNVSR